MQNYRSFAKSIVAMGACLALSLFAVPAQAESSTRAGILRCSVGGGIGLIVTSKKPLSCSFRQSGGGVERYTGTIRKFGLDLGVTKRGVLVWAVLAPARRVPGGALAGDYVGASAEASAGAGVGANLLVGGFRDSFSLQPLSANAQTGVNLALGVTDLHLDSRRRR